MTEHSPFRLALSLGAVCAAAYACTNEPEKDLRFGFGPPSAGTGNLAGSGPLTSAGRGSSGGSSGSGSGGAGGSAATGTGGTIHVDLDASMEAGEVTEDAACGTGRADANLLPVNLMMMFDRSGSMVNEDSIDPVTLLNRWDTATQGLITFFQDPTADGLGVALRFFPHDEPVAGCTSSNDACDAAACAEVLVDMGTLTAESAPTDAQEAALIDAIEMYPPPMSGSMGAGTPIYAALDGALRWASAYQLEHAEQKTVVVFVTDGEPNGCNEDFDDISDLAADALDMAGVSTYAIGLADSMGNGVNQDDMNQLAAAGGTEEAFFINDGPTASAALIEAFNAIRGMSLSCDFPMPEATNDGNPVDPLLVNVTFTAGDGTESTFTKVTDAAACGTATSWYYDDETAPTRIYLCPAACDAVASDPMAKFQVLVGCKPKIEPPH
jgi:hypothetical protein